MDSFLLFKSELLIADEISLIQSGVSARNAAFQDLLPRFFERHARDSAYCEVLTAEFLVSLEKFKKVELLRRFRELASAFSNSGSHVLLFVKAHVDLFLSARHAVVQAADVLGKRKSVFAVGFHELVSAEEASGLFGTILSSYNRVRTTPSRLARASKLYRDLVDTRESLTVIDLVALFAKVVESAFECEPDGQASFDSEATLRRKSQSTLDEDSPWLRQRAALQSVEQQYEEFFDQRQPGAKQLLAETVKASQRPPTQHRAGPGWQAPGSSKPRSYPVDERLADEIRSVLYRARSLREAARSKPADRTAPPRHKTGSKL